MKIEHMKSEHFQPRSVAYLDIFGLHDLFEGLAFRAPTLLVGPKGVGKTLGIAAYAKKVDSPIITFDCSEDVRRAHLIGMQVLRGDESPFLLGPLTTAFEVANEAGQCILCLEEINALSPSMQKVLNAPMDWRQRIEVPEAGKVFELKKGRKLWIAGTMNSSVYGGVYVLNEDLKSRVRLIALDYPPASSEKQVLREALGEQLKHIDQKMLDKAVLLAHETRQQALDYALSTRDLVQLLEDTIALDLTKALRILTGKFEDADRDTIRERISSVFGIQLNGKAGKKKR